MSARLLVSPKFCNCSHAQILVNAKLGNIGETCTRYECFCEHASSVTRVKIFRERSSNGRN